MNDSELPAEAPPPYTKEPSKKDNTLKVPSSLSTDARRSMEDETRELPGGWVRQYDADNEHQFFVDTWANPPRSIWHHPYDDEQYLASLHPDDRERITKLSAKRSKVDMVFEDTDEEADGAGPSSAGPSKAPQVGQSSSEILRTGEKKGFGRKLKDKVTGTTHEQRVAERQQRAKQEQEAYEAHRVFRAAMTRAAQTGEPQFVTKDRDGRDVYVEPPSYGGAYYGGPQPANYRGVNPYSQGPYANPNARFIRPPNPYAGRPYGYGYGGGLGLPLAGGLAGGLLLGGLLGGF